MQHLKASNVCKEFNKKQLYLIIIIVLIKEQYSSNISTGITEGSLCHTLFNELNELPKYTELDTKNNTAQS